MTCNHPKPPIALSASDHSRLLRLAETLARRNAELADQLFAELERAEALSDAAGARAVVQMGSTVQYETDTGEARTVTLVFPQDENINAGRISILTPIGVALIGLGVGDAIDWRTREGRTRRLTVTWIGRPSTPVAAPHDEAVVAP
jgi:regulator of nucleoside diphosphate kinase